jgi:hypothetical protein
VFARVGKGGTGCFGHPCGRAGRGIAREWTSKRQTDVPSEPIRIPTRQSWCSRVTKTSTFTVPTVACLNTIFGRSARAREKAVATTPQEEGNA